MAKIIFWNLCCLKKITSYLIRFPLIKIRRDLPNLVIWCCQLNASACPFMDQILIYVICLVSSRLKIVVAQKQGNIWQHLRRSDPGYFLNFSVATTTLSIKLNTQWIYVVFRYSFTWKAKDVWISRLDSLLRPNPPMPMAAAMFGFRKHVVKYLSAHFKISWPTHLIIVLIMRGNQCDQIGCFTKVIGKNYLQKYAKKIGDSKACLKYINWCKNCFFRPLLEIFGQLFTPTPGHTGGKAQTTLSVERFSQIPPHPDPLTIISVANLINILWS